MYAYSNHIITRLSIQTAGLAFGGTGLCSYRVRGVDGNCAEHLTVESFLYGRILRLSFQSLGLDLEEASRYNNCDMICIVRNIT